MKNMGEVVFSYFIIVIIIARGENLAVSIEASTPAAAINIEETCVSCEIKELEKLSETLDAPEVPSNTARYPVDGNETGGKESGDATTLKEIESLPFGSLPVDRKRLRLLHDILIGKSKLFNIYKILIAAGQCPTNKSSNNDSGKFTPGLMNVTEINKNSWATAKELEDLSDEGMNELLQNTREPSSLSTKTSHRFHRSTDGENSVTIEPDLTTIFTDEKYDLFNSSVTETTLKLNSEFKSNSFPQMEEIESVEDAEEGSEGISADFNPSKSVEIHSEFEEGVGEGFTKDLNNGTEVNKNFENTEDWDYPAQGTIKVQISSSPRSENEEAVTTEEIKPDARNENLETIAAYVSPFTRTSTLSSIDEKIALNFGENSSNAIDDREVSSTSFSPFTSRSTTQETATSGPNDHPQGGDDAEENFHDSISNFQPLTDSQLSTTPNYTTESSTDDYSFTSRAETVPEIRTTKKKVTMKIGEFLTSIPRPLDPVFAKKNAGETVNHVSRVYSFQEKKKSAVNSNLDDFRGGFNAVKNRRRYHIENEIDDSDQKPTPTKSSTSKLSRWPLSPGTKTRFRKPGAKSPSKRGGINTDLQKSYRWFYRLGQVPDKTAKGIEVEWKSRN